MKAGAFAALVAAAAAAVSSAWFVMRQTGAPAGKGAASAGEPAVLVPGLAGSAESAVSIEITGSDGAVLRLARAEGAGWGLADRGGYPVDTAKLRPFVIALAGLRVVEPKTASAANHAALGLAEPGAGSGAGSRVRVFGAGEAVLADVVLGNPVFQGGAQRLFARRSGEDQTFLVEGDVRASASVSAWIDVNVLSLGRDEIERVEVESEEGAYTLVGGLENGVLAFVVEPMPEGKEMASRFIGGSVAGVFSSLRAEDLAAESTLEGAARLGEATAFTKSGLSATVAVFRLGEGDGEQTWVTIAASGEGAEAINERVSGWAVRVEPFTAEALLRPLGEMLTDAEPEPTGLEPEQDVTPTDGAGPDPAIPPGLAPPDED